MAYEFRLTTDGGDHLTTEGGDRLLLYSFATDTSLMYGLLIDWDCDDAFSEGDHEQDYIVRWSADRGRDRLIGAPGSGFESYRVGKMTIGLDNSTGRYNPYCDSSPLYGSISPGCLMNFSVAAYDPSTDNVLGYNSYNIFTGFVQDIQQAGWNNTAIITCKDGLGMLNSEIEQIGTTDYVDDVQGWVENIADKAGYPFTVTASNEDTNVITVTNAGSSVINGVYRQSGTENGKPKYAKVMDETYQIYWDSSAWLIVDLSVYYSSSDAVDTPDLVTTWTVVGGSGGIGVAPVPTVSAGIGFLDVMYFKKNKALDELQSLAAATLGTIACEADGTLAYHSVFDADAAVATLTDGITLNQPLFSNPWEVTRNTILLRGYQLDYAQPATYYLLHDGAPGSRGASVGLAPGEWLDITNQYFIATDWNDNMVYTVFEGGVPSVSVSVTSSKNAEYATTDATITALAITGSLTYNGVEWGTVRLTNPTTDTYYAHRVSVGDSTYMFDRKREDFTYGETASSWDNNNFITAENNYINVLYRLFGGVNYTTPQVAPQYYQERIDMIGALLLNYLGTSRSTVTLEIEARTETQFALDVEKRVTYNSTLLGLNTDYRVAGLRHQTLGSPQAVKTTVHLYPVIPTT